MTKNGIYSSGVLPEIEDLRVMHVPVYELAFLWGIGPRVDEACVDHMKGFSYSAPYEDLKLKPSREAAASRATRRSRAP